MLWGRLPGPGFYWLSDDARGLLLALGLTAAMTLFSVTLVTLAHVGLLSGAVFLRGLHLGQTWFSPSLETEYRAQV